ncbi:hypothetical protein FOA52_007547 [Chlamydomonas sp. UWO 241]|nr:hypothetical protein FOA52_007547 [Chlamydomonas sp. UWO 241]
MYNAASWFGQAFSAALGFPARRASGAPCSTSGHARSSRDLSSIVPCAIRLEELPASALDCIVAQLSDPRDLAALMLTSRRLNDHASQPNVWCRVVLDALARQNWVGPLWSLPPTLPTAGVDYAMGEGPLELHPEQGLCLGPTVHRDAAALRGLLFWLESRTSLNQPAIAYDRYGYQWHELQVNGQRHHCMVGRHEALHLSGTLRVFNLASHLTAIAQVVVGLVRMPDSNACDDHPTVVCKVAVYHGVPHGRGGQSVSLAGRLMMPAGSLRPGRYELRVHHDLQYSTASALENFDRVAGRDGRRFTGAFITVVESD